MDKRVIGRPVNVTLCRDGLTAPWGFRLHGGQDFDNPLLVQKVTPLSAADGFLKRGDLIVKIDGFDAANLTHDAALNLIANAGSSINLSLLRPESADNRVRFVDDFPVNEREERSNINPFDYDDDQERRFLVTEQAKKLAGIMKASLQQNSSKEPKPSTFRKNLRLNRFPVSPISSKIGVKILYGYLVTGANIKELFMACLR
uniref:PDZ domain-containing protein n=1 Tax=Romanomermis culicivorax TaxID=13658 RepID=A0A915K3E8_ROMCU